MPVLIPRGPAPEADPRLAQIVGALEAYLADHPGATAEAYSQGLYMIRVRVTDPAFAGMTDPDRVRAVFDYIWRLPPDIAADVTFLVPVAPGEKPSRSSRKFDTPVPLDEPPPRRPRPAAPPQTVFSGSNGRSDAPSSAP